MNWDFVRLDSLYNIARGGSPRPIKKFLTHDQSGINWVKISDATASGKYIFETKEKITRDGISKSRLVNKGDFILSNSMSFGRPYIMATEGCIHDGWLVLSPKGEEIDQDFLYYLLGSAFVFKQFDSLASGSTVRNLNIDLVSSVKIPLLPLEEQKQIVEILDEAFAGIDQAIKNTEQNIKNAKELFESYLNNIFTHKGEGWVEDRLVNLTSKIGSGATPKGGAESYKAEGISLIRSLNVHDRSFKPNKLAFIDNGQAEKLSNVVIESEDVLFNITGASVARCCIVPSEYLPARVNQHVSILRPIPEKLSSRFLCYLMTSPTYKEKLLGIGEEGGSTRQAITKMQLQELEIFYPKERGEQDRIIEKINEVEVESKQLESNYQQKLAALKELKQSLLQKAFAGELTSNRQEAA